jgi:catechol 2,3-dioxygenase-like lactoylglutathione lyase family enzyme
VPRVVHFELLSDDPEQSVKFFEEAFGWKNQSWEGQSYWLVETGDEELGINGGIMRTSDFPHTQNAVVTVMVDDIGAAQGRLTRAPDRRGGLRRLRRRPAGRRVRALEGGVKVEPVVPILNVGGAEVSAAAQPHVTGWLVRG